MAGTPDVQMSAPQTPSATPRAASDAAAELWHFPFSHFNEKVRWALDHKGVPYQRHPLSPGLHPPTLLRLSGQVKTPLLKLDGEMIHDSTTIVIELERRFPKPSLLPADPAQRKQVLKLEDQYDEWFGDAVRSLFYSYLWPDWDICTNVSTVAMPEGTGTWFKLMYPFLKPLIFFQMDLAKGKLEKTRARFHQHLDKVDEQRAGRQYLTGERFTLADLTAAAMLAPLAAPRAFPYQLPEPIPEGLIAYRRELSEHPTMIWANQVYEQHR